MAEYFEVEEIVKGYDGRIVARMLSYLRPYRALTVIAAAALALSTVGELFLPVLTQRVLDDAILAKYLAVDMDALERYAPELSPPAKAAIDRIIGDGEARRLGTKLYLKRSASLRLNASGEEALKRYGILDGRDWYLMEAPPETPQAAAVSRLGTVTERHGTMAAFPLEALKGTSFRDIRLLRAADIRFLSVAVLLFFVILALVLAATFVQTWTTTLIGQRVMKDLRQALFRKTAGQSTAFLSRHPVGRLVTRLSSDVETINEFFTSVLAAFLKDLSVMVGVLATLFFLSPPLAAVALLTLPPVAVATGISRIKARDAFRRQRVASSRVNAFLSERLSGVQVVQLFAQEGKGGTEFRSRNGELLRANLGEMYVFATFRPLVDFFSSLTVAVIIAVGGSMVMNLSLSLGVLIAFINLVQMFYSPVQDIAEKYTMLQSAMAGGERVFELLDTEEAIPDTGTRSMNGAVRGHIEFDRVRFSYKSGEPVLKDISFTVKPGEMVAIVGYTGAGKTTITNLLARLWDIEGGEIRLDGIPIVDIPLPELRRAALPVLQDVFLFAGTVADNIRLGLPLSDQEVVEAAKVVHAHEFISRLPEGYATKLSEGASNISSGQRQLISFARVIAHNPSIVILDEATSSVDTETEHLIQLGIQRVLAGRTSLVIAHRLSTIRHSDRILVLSGGRVAEAGTHQELIERGSLYAGLYRLQYEHSGP